MIKAGFETTEPRTGTRARVLQAAAEIDGMGWVLEVECPEGAPSSILEHAHTEWLETFEILEGAARYKLDGREAGAAGVAHRRRTGAPRGARHALVPTHEAKPTNELGEAHWPQLVPRLFDQRVARGPCGLHSEGEARGG